MHSNTNKQKSYHFQYIVFSNFFETICDPNNNQFYFQSNLFFFVFFSHCDFRFQIFINEPRYQPASIETSPKNVAATFKNSVTVTKVLKVSIEWRNFLTMCLYRVRHYFRPVNFSALFDWHILRLYSGWFIQGYFSHDSGSE